jgi:hypothetical protein
MNPDRLFDQNWAVALLERAQAKLRAEFEADGKPDVRGIEWRLPANPRRVGGLNTPGEAADVAVAGQLAYRADGAGGLQVIDISDSAAPRRAGGNSGVDAFAVAVSGSRMFVAAGADGLVILDSFCPPSRLSKPTFGDWGVAPLQASGARDTTFNSRRILGTLRDVALQRDGRILLAGGSAVSAAVSGITSRPPPPAAGPGPAGSGNRSSREPPDRLVA